MMHFFSSFSKPFDKSISVLHSLDLDFFIFTVIGSVLVYSISVLAQQPTGGCFVSESFCLNQVYSTVKNISLRQTLRKFCLFSYTLFLYLAIVQLLLHTNIYYCLLKL